jgi:hypothetical protein
VNFLKHLLLQNQVANFNVIGTKHSWMKGIQNCSNKGPVQVPLGQKISNLYGSFLTWYKNMAPGGRGSGAQLGVLFLHAFWKIFLKSQLPLGQKSSILHEHFWHSAKSS